MTVLFIVAIMGGSLALVGEMWQTSVKREKELELLFVGNQYRKAIERYYLSGPQRQYPRALEDLLKDARLPATARYLRRIYPDPITGKAEWGMVKAPDGGILGVHSVSEEAPLKRARFKPRDAAFDGAQKYSDWKFVHTAPAQPPAKPGAKPGPQPGPKPAAPPVLPEGDN
jgi:type II secretory pathway pseudopilin PulG